MKKKYFLIVLVLAISAYFISTGGNSLQNSVNEKVLYNLSYGNDPLQKFDLYLPKDRATDKTKVIVFIHGGGWTSGDKENTNKIVTYLKNNHPNHAIVTTNYRLAKITEPTQPAFPNQFIDIDRLINHIKNEKETYLIQPEFALIGTSAGGHIALMYDYVYDKNNRVKMVCSIVGPTNLTDSFYRNNPNFKSFSKILLDKSAYPENSNYLKVVSPLFQVNQNSSPTLLFYGNTDTVVPYSNGETLHEQLNKLDIINEYYLFNGGHRDYWDQNFEKTLSNFIKNNFAILD